MLAVSSRKVKLPSMIHGHRHNRNAKAPMPETDINFSNVGPHNSYPLENGSYFRNKTMILGFSFPKNWIQKIKIERLRVYIQAANLFTHNQLFRT